MVHAVNEMINKISDIQSQIVTVRGNYLNSIIELRQQVYSNELNNESDYVDLIKLAIETIQEVDTATRVILANEIPSSCIDNLLKFLDDIEELSGIAISNCVEVNSVTEAIKIFNSLNSFEFELNGLIQVILKEIINKNPLTQPLAVTAQQYENFQEEAGKLSEKLTPVSENINKLGNSDIINKKECFDAIITTMISAINSISKQLSICRNFSSRGARIGITLNAHDFFPEISNKN